MTDFARAGHPGPSSPAGAICLGALVGSERACLLSALELSPTHNSRGDTYNLVCFSANCPRLHTELLSQTQLVGIGYESRHALYEHAPSTPAVRRISVSLEGEDPASHRRMELRAFDGSEDHVAVEEHK